MGLGVPLWNVLVVEDQQLIRSMIRAGVERTGVCRVVAEAANGEQAIRIVRQIADLDLILMDLTMPVMGGESATEQILLLRPTMPIIALTMHSDQGSLSAMIAAGATSYISKAERPEELLRAITAAMQGEHYFPPNTSAALVDLIRRPNCYGGVYMTRREFQTLRLTAAGHSIKEMARLMDVAPATVAGYRKSLGRKIGRAGPYALTAFFFEHERKE